MNYDFPMTRALTETSAQRAARIKSRQMSHDDAAAAGLAFAAVAGIIAFCFGLGELLSGK